MKLKEKTREGGKVHRKYDFPKTPYERLIESGQLPEEEKEELRTLYLSLNPAQLKRTIEAKLDKFYQIYQEKTKTPIIKPYKKQKPRLVTNYMIQPEPIQLPT